jgi:hypothetical protein
VVIRLIAICVFALPLVGDPGTLPWYAQAFWLLMVGGCLTFLVHTLRMACARTRLCLDRKNATLVSATPLGSKTYACALYELQLGPVDVLRSDEGDDAANTWCLRLTFGPQRVEAFVAHDEPELLHLRSSIVDWLSSNAPHLAGPQHSPGATQL